jgi:hypothetical protein
MKINQKGTRLAPQKKASVFVVTPIQVEHLSSVPFEERWSEQRASLFSYGAHYDGKRFCSSSLGSKFFETKEGPFIVELPGACTIKPLQQ